MNKLIETFNLPRLNQEENLNKLIVNKDIESVSKVFTTNKIPESHVLMG